MTLAFGTRFLRGELLWPEHSLPLLPRPVSDQLLPAVGHTAHDAHIRESDGNADAERGREQHRKQNRRRGCLRLLRAATGGASKHSTDMAALWLPSRRRASARRVCYGCVLSTGGAAELGRREWHAICARRLVSAERHQRGSGSTSGRYSSRLGRCSSGDAVASSWHGCNLLMKSLQPSNLARTWLPPPQNHRRSCYVALPFRASSVDAPIDVPKPLGGSPGLLVTKSAEALLRCGESLAEPLPCSSS